jgi:dimethylaniline monooxygenase (N-oxide forming)
MKVAVVGAGPSGLVTLKYLITAHNLLPIEPFDVHLFESEARIGGTFRYRIYKDVEVRLLVLHKFGSQRSLSNSLDQLVFSTRFTTFSDFRCSAEAPDFLSAKEYCAIWPLMPLNLICGSTSISPLMLQTFIGT